MNGCAARCRRRRLRRALRERGAGGRIGGPGRWARRGLACAALLCVAAGTARAQEPAPSITVSDAWVRTPPAPVAAVFLVIRNGGGADDRLLRAEAAFARSVELHRSFQEDGVIRMRPVGTIPVPAGATVRLEPGGYHVMLMGLERKPAIGERVRLTLVFERAGPVEVDAEVRGM